LTDNSLHLMETCGLIYSRGRDQLICFGENMPVDVLLVRDDDIPELVAEGICDLGIVGMNVFREKVGDAWTCGRARARLRPLPLVDRGAARLRYESARSLEGLRIATSYPHILPPGWTSRV
jgi:ATP phosphoribosyltransferase